MTAHAQDLSSMSPGGRALLNSIRRTLELLGEHEKHSAVEVAAIIEHLVAHVRSWKPMALAGMPTSPDPVAEIRRELADGAEYRLSRAGDCVVVALRDAHDGDALVAMTAIEIVRLRHDLAAVAGGAP